MKKVVLVFFLCVASIGVFAQSGYEIKIDLKNYKDNLAYLAYYQFDKTLIKDTCSTVQNGKIIFKGVSKLNTGIYAVVSKQKSLLFNFYVDHETQKLSFKSDAAVDFAEDVIALNSDRQNDFLNYVQYLGQQNNTFMALREQTVLRTKKDTLSLLEKQLEFEKKIAEFEENFLTRSKGTYIGSVLNLKIDKVLKEIPKASNGRPDSIVAFNFYKNHYWDEVDFKDDAVMRNPFFFGKLKKYFDIVVSAHPDSISSEVDKILSQTNQNSMLFKTMLAYFTTTYETAPIMGYDKVFVHLVDNYFKTGKAAAIYNDNGVVQKIIDRAEKLRPLLIGATAQDLLMIKAEDFNKMKGLGFEDAKSSTEITKLYYKNLAEITKMYVKLSEVKADYTILVFWDPDCSHCQIEIPILLQAYNEMIKEKKDVKVYSVSMEYEGEKYLNYISEHQLPWINVYDGARINNTTQKYDINSTPIIFILDKNKVIKAKRISSSQVKEIIDTLEMENKKVKG